VRGSWLRVLGTFALIGLFVGLPGPVIPFGFLAFIQPPIIETIYPLLTMNYVLVLFPLGFLVSGLLYGDLYAVHERRNEDQAEEPSHEEGEGRSWPVSHQPVDSGPCRMRLNRTEGATECTKRSSTRSKTR
jgi:hypothetical protein